MNWRWISISALLAALVIGYGALRGRDVAPEIVAEAPLQPTYYLRNAVITEMAPTGEAQTSFAAARMEMQPATDDLTMTDVNVSYHQSPTQHWNLTAERAFKAGDSPIIRLSGNVVLEPEQSDPEARLLAEELAIDTESNVAFSTRSPVKIRFGQHAIEVRSFRFDMNDQILSLQTGEGRHAPAH